MNLDVLPRSLVGCIARSISIVGSPMGQWVKVPPPASRAGMSHAREESDANCLPPGVPKIAAAPPPWKIIQTPTQLAILQITIDPKASTRLWTVTERFHLVTSGEPFEVICENNRDLEYLPGVPVR